MRRNDPRRIAARKKSARETAVGIYASEFGRLPDVRIPEDAILIERLTKKVRAARRVKR